MTGHADDKQLPRHSMFTMDENVSCVDALIRDDTHINMPATTEELHIPLCTVHSHIHNWTIWVPQALADDHKPYEIRISLICSTCYTDQWGQFLHLTFTEDKTLVNQAKPQTQKPSMIQKHVQKWKFHTIQHLSEHFLMYHMLNLWIPE